MTAQGVPESLLPEVLAGRYRVGRELGRGGMARSLSPGRLVAVAALLLIGARPAWPQGTTIAGRVTDDRGEPIAGATVALLGTSLIAATTREGRYTLQVGGDRLTGREVTLQARAIGRRPSSVTFVLTPGPHLRDFQLVPDPFRLEEIVVSGVLQETEQRKLALSVSTVSEAQLQEVPSQDPFTALIGKAPGVVVTSAAGGAPGAPAYIRLRSATSITPTSQTQQPLIIVDGLLTREGIADLNVLDIDRVEVVKGPAGASLYGSDAAAGVVQIFTRRGRNAPEGKTLITLRAEVGQTSPIRLLERNQSHHCANYDPAGDFARNQDGTVDCDVKADGYMDLPYPALAPWRNQQENFMGSRGVVTTYLSLARNQGGTNLFGSWDRTGNNGLIDVPGLELKGLVRNNLRLNLDQVVSDRLDVSVGGFFAQSDNQIPETAGGIWEELQVVPPDVDLLAPNSNGQPYQVDAGRYSAMPINFAPNPLYSMSVRDVTSDRSRFQANARARWRPWPWLLAEGAYAYDRLDEDYREITPRGTLTPGLESSTGTIAVVNMAYRSSNKSANLRGSHRVGDLAGSLTLAALMESSDRQTETSTGANFTSSGSPTLGNTDPTQQRTYHVAETIRATNFSGGIQLDYKDRYLLDALVRTDATSLFGEDARRRTFYRASGAWRVNRDFPIRGVDELRVRASVGTAGLRPPFEAQYETFTLNAGVIQPDILGNRDLRPAYSTEWELGFNLDLASRLSVEYSYARKTTRDQVLLAPISSASGFSAQWQNAGTLEGYSHEAAVQVLLLNNRHWSWGLGLTFDRSGSTITELAVPAFTGAAGFLRYEVGVPYGAIHAARFVKSCAELRQNPANSSADCNFYEVNSDGYLIQKGTQGTTKESPIRFVDEAGQRNFVVDPTPDFILGFRTTVTWKGVSLYGLLDWRRGGYIADQARIRDILDGTFTGAFFDQRGKPDGFKKTPQYYEAINNVAAEPNDWTLVDGSYARLRELSVSWTLTQRDLARLGGARWLSGVRVAVIGRNLLTFTKFPGWDPETGFPGAFMAYGVAARRGGPGFGDPTTARVAQPTYPSFRTVSAVLEVSF